MKKTILMSVLGLSLLTASLPVLAKEMNSGGFKGPGMAPITVKEALNLKDDTRVTLKGSIEKNLGVDQYLFKDSTGSIEVEIDKKRWDGITVTPEDMIEISGKIDKDWGSTEIDVKRIQKIEK